MVKTKQLATMLDTDLSSNFVGVHSSRPSRDSEPGADLGIRSPQCDQVENLPLAAAETYPLKTLLAEKRYGLTHSSPLVSPAIWPCRRSFRHDANVQVARSQGAPCWNSAYATCRSPPCPLGPSCERAKGVVVLTRFDARP